MPCTDATEQKATKRAYYLANKERIKAKSRANRKAKLQYYREYDRNRHPARSVENAQRCRAWREKNPDRDRQNKADWTLKNPERVKAAKRRHYEKNTDLTKRRAAAWVEGNPDRRRQIANEYAKRNPEKFRAACHKRRALKLNAAVDTDRKAYVAFIRKVRFCERISCYWCGENVPKGKRHIDHIVALTRGGKDSVHNLCCSCQPCNSRKSNKMPEEFTGQFELDFSK